MVATVKVVVSHDGTAKAIVANVTDPADKEFNNRVTPPPKNLSSNQRNTLYLKRNSISQATNFP